MTGKVICEECWRRRPRYRASHVDAQRRVHWVCRECWTKLDYDQFEHAVDCQCPHCVGLRALYGHN